MNVRGERIIVFGDSTSHHGADNAPEIWDVDTGSGRVSGQPGDLLASMLAEQGAAAVRVNARVGRSAHNFFGREDVTSLLGSDQAFAPTKVLVILGTNDMGLNLEVDGAEMEKLRDFYKGLGAEVWAVGPWAYASEQLNQQAEPVVSMMQDVFGSRFIDPRPVTAVVGRARDGIHFGGEAARQTADALLPLVMSSSTGVGTMWAIGLGVLAVIGGAFAYSRWKVPTAHSLTGGKRKKPDYDTSTGAGQKRLMDESMNREHVTPHRITRETGNDYGSDPLGPDENGVFRWRMVPSGDVVDQDELRRRLPPPKLKGLDEYCNPQLAPAAFKRCTARSKRSALGDGEALAGYRVAYSTAVPEGARRPGHYVERIVDPQELQTIEGAMRLRRSYKKLGFWAWVEDDQGNFVPVDGAKRPHPTYLDWKKNLKGLGSPLGARYSGDTKRPTNEHPAHEFRRLLQESDPAAMEVAQDLALENNLKLSDLDGEHVPRGFFELTSPIPPNPNNPHGAPRTVVSWHVPVKAGDTTSLKSQTFAYAVSFRRYADDEGTRHGYILTSDDIPELKGNRKLTWRKARKEAAADAWAIAKAIKQLPDDASEADVKATIKKALANDNSQPPELFGLDGRRKKHTLGHDVIEAIVGDDLAGSALGALAWKKAGKGIYKADSPKGVYTIDGNGYGRNKWTVTYPDGDYGMADALAEAKIWAESHEAERKS